MSGSENEKNAILVKVLIDPDDVIVNDNFLKYFDEQLNGSTSTTNSINPSYELGKYAVETSKLTSLCRKKKG